MAELIDRLKSAVGDTYRIEKELGGGGMSRVFLAEEIELGRRVVIKVLPPEMGAEVNKERFQREIQLAAKLQHPHVVSLLTAGADGDLLYYVMPYIEGESLRVKLNREGELPVDEAVRLLEEIVDALAYAHSEGVVHRDIKPDNVLLSRDHAVVTDFGVSKAVSASSGASTLTSLGVALGTPAYMAPEQAAADPHTDHRADIYAVGAMAYEMLTGRPPFMAPTPQAVMAAHVSETPEPVTRHRTAVSEALNALVMRCLEKKAADRWQSAAELVPQLKAMATPSGGMAPTGVQPVVTVSAETAVKRSQPIRVLALFALASIGALAIVYALIRVLGLPDWVFVGAIALLAVGLPIILVTGHHERRRALARTTGTAIPTPSSAIRRWFVWRKAIIGGALAFTGLGIATAVYMAMRLLGIGPVGTLVAAGVLEEQAAIILADFADHAGDSSLANAVTEALRVDLAQSEVVTLIPVGDLSDALARMRRARDAPLDEPTAREMAVREGIPAVLTGEINAAGSGYVLTATVVEPESGNVLAAFRETADDETDVIAAIDRLSRNLRKRIGESFNTIRSQQSLDRVTTSSLEALRRYSAGLRAEQAGDDERAITLFQQAIDLDSSFAMAYRKLSVVLSNTSASQSLAIETARQAYELRDRLPEQERYRAVVYYYTAAAQDRERAIAEARSALERYPDDATILITLAYHLNALRQHEEAAVLARRGRAYGTSAFTHEIQAFLGQGRYAAAESTLAEFAAMRPGHAVNFFMRTGIAVAQGDYGTATGVLDDLLAQPSYGRAYRAIATSGLGDVEQIRGKLRNAERYLRYNMELSAERELPDDVIRGAVRRAWLDALYRDDVAAAMRTVGDALERFPLELMDPLDRPYPELAEFYASVGELDRARRLLAEAEVVVPADVRRGVEEYHAADGALALAERRYDDAVAAFRALYAWGVDLCGPCGLYRLGAAYDLAGQVDSAVAVWERALAARTIWSVSAEADALPQTYRRLGEIYERRGDREKAVAYYSEFVQLWADADTELQPVVEDVRGRIARLVGER